MGLVFLILGWVILVLGIALAVLTGVGLNDVLRNSQEGAAGLAIVTASAALAPALAAILTGLLFLAIGVALRRLGRIEHHTLLAASALGDLNRRVGQELPRA